MIQFQGFKPESMPKIANSLGYNGDMQGFQQYLDQNKDKQDIMNQYMQKAQQMANGGVPNKYKGFSKLPEPVQQKIDPDLARKYQPGGFVYSSGFDQNTNTLTQGNTVGTSASGGNLVKSGSGFKLLTPSGSGTTATFANLQDAFDYMSNTPIDPITGDYSGITTVGGGANTIGQNLTNTNTNTGTGTQTTGTAQADPRALTQQLVPAQNIAQGSNVQQAMTQQALNPGLPSGAALVPVGTQVQAGQLVDPTSGQVTGAAAVPTSLAQTTTASGTTAGQAGQMQAALSAPSVQGAAAQGAQGALSAGAQAQAAQANPQQLAQLGLQAAQGQAAQVQGAPSPMQFTSGQQISGSAVDQGQVQQIFGQQPLEASTVSGELDSLMQDFEGGKTPSWAAGAMRAASAAMAARGLGASSLAGMAVVQAAMESALPIAQMDAANKQQIAIESARQRANFLQMEFTQEFEAKVRNATRVSEIANINFNAEQQVALENARLAQTMDLANLTNRQAIVMAEAAAISQLELQNLTNQQQAAVQNAQAFLQIDMANLSNEQATVIFKNRKVEEERG